MKVENIIYRKGKNKMAKNKNECSSCERLGKVGGQAVLEGVMMKAGERTVTTCRKEDGSLVVNDATFVSVRKKHKILNIPILRGFVNFIEMMMLSFKTLGASADALGIEEEEGKCERWLKKHLGVGLVDVIMVIAMILGVALSLFLFMFLPTWAANGIDRLVEMITDGGGIGESWLAVIEGGMKVIIFLLYLILVSLIPDIYRTFQYHGAEHKSIACFESGEELTPENAKKHKRFHPRCGTSFMFLMILIGIFIGTFVRYILPGEEAFGSRILYSVVIAVTKILLLPITMGIGYEILMIAGKHDNVLTRIISAPGLWVQRITTKEPTPDMLEVAIISIKCALRDDFPEFREFYENREWEAHAEESAEKTEDGENAEVEAMPEDGAEASEPEKCEGEE